MSGRRPPRRGPAAGRTGAVWLRGIWVAVVALVCSEARATHAFFDALPEPPELYRVRLEKSVMVPMRDGVRLSSDIFRPEGLTGRLPVVMIRTPYDKRQWRVYTEARLGGTAGGSPRTEYDPYIFAARGYVVVVQDARGRFESEGEFFANDRIDGRDGYDTISWIVAQPWSSGKVGTVGCSYLGETQHRLASWRHPNHTVAIAMSGSSDPAPGGVYNFGFMRYGMLKLAAAAQWSELTAGPFGYGPPANVDRQAWFQSDAARWYATQPVLPQRTPQERLAALATLPVENVMRALFGSGVPTVFEEWLQMNDTPGADYWRVRQGLISATDRFDVPTLHINSWYDGTPESTLDLFRIFRQNAESARARDNQFLIMSASGHCQFDHMTRQSVIGDRPVGDAQLNYRAIYLAWLDHWLRDANNGITGMPRVSSFVLGKGSWRLASSWPIAGTHPVTWYLSSAERGANSRNGDGALAMRPVGQSGRAYDRYVYDPLFPSPSVGGGACCLGPEVKSGGVDQRSVELRNDVLVYTSAPLAQPLEVAGQARAELFVSSSARDTDFIAKLVDVYPDGTAYIVHEGVLRARWRNGFEHPAWLSAGEVVPISIVIEATHNYFPAGHRIRVDISSSSFPMWERNLNTGGPNYSESTPVVATNSIHHSRRYPAALILPVVPAEK
jgi:uncharacterized protein